MRVRRVIIVILCLVQSSECQRNNLTTSTVADVVRVSASFISSFLNAKSTAFLPSPLAKYLKGPQGSRSEGLISLLVRLFDERSERVQEWALRGFISLLPLMNQVLTEREGRTRRRRTPEGFSIFRFILQRPEVANLLTQMQNSDLIEQLLLESEGLDGADCVRLLLCKTKPIIGGMQNSLRFFLKQMEKCDEECSRVEEAWRRASVEDRMYFFLPGVREVAAFGDACEERYPGCGY